MYNPKSLKAEEFISDEEILDTLDYAQKNSDNIVLIDSILEKARKRKGLDQSDLIGSFVTARKKRRNTSAGTTDKKRFLRKPDCNVRSSLSFKLLRQRMRVLSVSS